jgi:hypothetical protein
VVWQTAAVSRSNPATQCYRTIASVGAGNSSRLDPQTAPMLSSSGNRDSLAERGEFGTRGACSSQRLPGRGHCSWARSRRRTLDSVRPAISALRQLHPNIFRRRRCQEAPPVQFLMRGTTTKKRRNGVSVRGYRGFRSALLRTPFERHVGD